MPDEVSSHLSPRTLRDYRGGRTDPARTLAVSDHLAACAACRQALAETDDGPGYELLAAAADGTLEPAARQALSARLEEDPATAAELADLERFREEMRAQAGRTYGPADGQTRQPAEPGRIVTPPAGVWGRPGRWLAAVAAVLVVLAAGWWALPRPVSRPADPLLTDASGNRADLASLPADVRAAVLRTLQNGHLETSPVLAGLRPPAGTLAGPSARAGFYPQSPVGEVTRDLQPVLNWSARPEATGYVVTLLEDDGDHSLRSGELPATETRWTPPQPLRPGATYSWQVEARRGPDTLDRAPKPPAPEARFRVLDAAQSAELSRLEARYDGFPLVLATAFAQAGVMHEAGYWLDVLELEHPKSALAHQLRTETVGLVKIRPRRARREPSRTDAASPAAPPR